MNHTEYITARNRNLLTLLELGLDANKLYPLLKPTVEPWCFSEQLNAMSEKVEQLRGKANKRGKVYTYTTR